MLAVLLLCAFVALGSSQDDETVFYGGQFRIPLLRRADKLTVWSVPNDDKVLWTSENSSAMQDPRHSWDGISFLMTQMTQRDSGQYDVWDKRNNRLSSVVISVVANEQTCELNPGDDVNLKSDIPSTSCNLYFTPEDETESKELARRGRLNYRANCRAIYFYRPCQFNIEGVDTSCRGTYEIKDNNGDTALEVIVTVSDEEESDDGSSYGWIGILAFISPALCYCCFCCKSSSKKESADSEEGEEAAADAGPTQVQVNSSVENQRLPYSAELPPAPSAPMMQDFYDSQPPSYEEAMALTQETGGSLHPHTSPAEPLPPVPLSLEADNSGVHTSDRLNFL